MPAAIVYPTDAADVASAVECATSAGYAIAARSGGHSYASSSTGQSNGSLVIDLGAFRAVVVHADGTATVGAGNRLGDVALALASNGRAIPHGTCPRVGIGGHASLGGFGLPSRMWGLTLDSVLAVDLVLPNSSIRTNESDPDILYAIRGAAPAFAIITSFHFRTFAVPAKPITAFAFSYSPTDARTVSHAFSAFQSFGAGDVPPEISLAFKMTTSRAFSCASPSSPSP